MNKFFEEVERVAEETGKDVVEIIDHVILFLEGKKLEKVGSAGLEKTPIEAAPSVEPVAPVEAAPATSGEPVADAVGASVSGSTADAVAPTTETPTA